MKKDVSSILDVKVNCTGSHVSFLAEVNQDADSSVWVWDTHGSHVLTYDFGARKRTPISHFWDSTEALLLAVESTANESLKDEDVSLTNEVTTIFVTGEDGLLLQHRLEISPTEGALIGLSLPYLLHIDRKEKKEDGKIRAIDKKVIPSFEGLEDASQNLKTAMVSFSYNLTIGNMDEAFKAVRAINNDKVWENMARMCVSSKRIDVAQVCIGSMGNAVGARALRDAHDADHPEVAAAALVDNAYSLL